MLLLVHKYKDGVFVDQFVTQGPSKWSKSHFTASIKALEAVGSADGSELRLMQVLTDPDDVAIQVQEGARPQRDRGNDKFAELDCADCNKRTTHEHYPDGDYWVCTACGHWAGHGPSRRR